MNTPVTVVRCPSYKDPDFEPALDRLLALLGGLESFVGPGQRVLLKPNCITAAAPERAATTHPAIILSMARRVRELGATPVVGDSPAWGGLAASLRTAGALEPLRELGVEVIDFARGRRVANLPLRVYPHFRIATDVLAADRIINLPKLKAHKQLVLTAAVKNMFGCVAGKRKAWWHFSAGDKRNYFGWMLVELFDLLRPCLTIVDAVVGQEGDGPINGRPRAFGWLAGGVDGIAIERVSAELVGIAPEKLRTLRAARELGIGQWDLARIDVLGESVDSLRITDFLMTEPMPIRFPLFRVLKSTVKNILLRRRRTTGDNPA